MPKSYNAKVKSVQNKKRDQSKRMNPNRGKHGCSRLHALRENPLKQASVHVKEADHNAEPATQFQNKRSLMGKIKNVFGKLRK